MPPERILVLHNRYREAGGEDRAFQREVALLRSHGLQVIEYVDTNQDVDESRPISAALEAVWSRRSRERIQEVIAGTRPVLAHFHNTFCRISPAAYSVCRRAGLAVVQTLHNYRLGCANGVCARDGRTCDTCLNSRMAWRGVWHRCYRSSRGASAAAAAVAAVHRSIGTYRNQVDAYISTSEFARRLHLHCGVPPHLSFVKPNFCEDAALPGGTPGGYALYAGRLAGGKGVSVLLEAWRRLDRRPPLKVAGDGPDAAALRAAGRDLPEVEFLGALPPARAREFMAAAEFLVQPSLLWENCATVVIEAFAAGVPVIASGHGSLAEMVEDGCTGLHFRPADSSDLAAKAAWLAAHREQRAAMARRARQCFEARYTPQANYAQLMEIYEAARRHRNRA